MHARRQNRALHFLRLFQIGNYEIQKCQSLKQYAQGRKSIFPALRGRRLQRQYASIFCRKRDRQQYHKQGNGNKEKQYFRCAPPTFHPLRRQGPRNQQNDKRQYPDGRCGEHGTPDNFAENPQFQRTVAEQLCTKPQQYEIAELRPQKRPAPFHRCPFGHFFAKES